MRSAARLAIRTTFRHEAIQCREDNIRTTCLRIAGAYVNPGLLRRISLTTYRKCGGGFAKTVRRRAHHGQGEALPCPGALRRDGGRGLRNPGEASLAPTYLYGLFEILQREGRV
ncbi:MAG: hypothetical protein LBM98_07740 [Oscillospiraceae bacterium]|nr:hypothetical protein [Oscillospiraceae bacterium]